MPIPALALTVAALAAAAAGDPAPRPPPLPAGEVPPALRLPAGVRPIRGEVSLTLDPAAERYRGRVRYPVVLDAPARVVWLHAEGLEIEEAKVGGRPARAVPAAGGLLGLVPDAPQPPGEATVEIAFAGTIDRVRSRGVYAAAEEGRWYAYTFFEPADARRAFPCFDEPSFKIPWRLSLTVKRGDRAVANTPALREAPDGGGTRVEFAETRPLPSYLVAFVVGPFDVVEAGAGGAARVPVRFVVPRGRGGETRYAASITARLLDLIEAETGVPYPYEKCDVAVVPRFWGTMEHPGIVALGQPLTLIPPIAETRERRLRYASIAAHELVHHWFGDLVTMAWWDDTWLNESLTSFVDPVITDALEPAWRRTARARAEGRASALAADALAAVKRLREPVGSRHEIEGAFDNAITYDKGAAVAAMYERFLGRAAWRAVLRDHLLAHADRTAASEDFLATLAARSTPAVAASLRGFLERPGVPLVRASVRCDGRGAAAVVRQERFLASGAPDPAATWAIPLCVRAGAGARVETACALVGGDGPEGELPLPFCPEWLWPNAGGTGYHLTALDAAALPGLWPHLAPAERLALATDASLLARRGDLPVEAALGRVGPLAASEDRLQVEASLALARLAQPEWLGPDDHARWRAFLRETWGPRARSLGWMPRRGEPDDTAALRRLVVPAVADEGEDAALAGEAAALARRWLADRRSVPAEAAWPALEVAARTGDAALFDRILAAARASRDRTVRARLLAFLGRFERPALADRALGLVASGEEDLRDTSGILRAALAGRETRWRAWALLRGRWDALAPRLRSDEASWLVAQAAGLACDPGRAAEVAAFLRPRAEAFDGAPAALARALEEAGACRAARARNGPAVARFLAR
ncbi:Peptidase M1 membrane alanine aminopeptidase [Anaeromyxobacter dehalogenans 2CP-1]|uniref:Aminopeptidase n=1 Tax=Anaeromyxobacter dehalogenans (strain ATCC BAA-258 / DSM 21875 / 2CP-1) TaxID=455488 RepID=B8JA03_ANAD2|nr:M1 family metallopeptidase [Anaeromyxobacter dehalogenans]ACL63706.1 Peptidase M1 membrane alanine aminopeptidase [Anaeromyxobacter dehalogenans 2CP-1]